MKTTGIVPARIDFSGPVPASADFGDVYHPRIGALAQARHVFLGGNGLPGRWSGRERFVILETGFGLGHNFLATWQAWRDDPARCERLFHVAIDRHPPTREDLRRAHAGSALADLADQLVDAWPPLVPGLHALAFDGGRVRLLLGFGDVADLLPQIECKADAIYLDGFAPARNPEMWSPAVLQAVGRHAAPGATAATWSVARTVREGLAAAGFSVETAPGLGGKREISVARFAPRFTPPPAPWLTPTPAREAVVVGAGLAGAAAAAALADLGLAVRVIDRQPRPAAETSGNPAGLFHGTVHADDGPHARWLRAAALHVERQLRGPIADGTVRGALEGLLRLGDDLGAMRALVERQRLPAAYVAAIDAEAATAQARVPLDRPAWRYAGGGWAAPADVVAHALQRPGIVFEGGIAITRLERAGDGWRLRDASGAVVAETALLVLAAAAEVDRLLAPLGLAPWPLTPTRGQVSGWLDEPTALRRPVAGGGYAIALPGGGLLCGATESADDDDAAVRDADHAVNFERLRRLTGIEPPADRSRWFGRVGWRLQAADRLPVVGPLPLPGWQPARPVTQVRQVPRLPGLQVLTALGGRGLTLAPLAGELLAARALGTPWPVERDLAAAVDPVRWQVRALRRPG